MDQVRMRLGRGVHPCVPAYTAGRGPFVAPPTPPKPAGLDFTAERQRHDGFVGRTALLARLDQLLIADRVDRWVVVIGGPGMGKSAVLAHWLTRRENAGDLVPHHFIRRGEYNWDDAATLVDSLVAQIEARFPDQRDPDADTRIHPAARLDATLRRVSKNELGPRGERLVVLIDGLDEYDMPAGSPALDPLSAFLPHVLPRGVSVLCACRPRHPYTDMLAKRGAVPLDLDDDQSFAADNEATVRTFWDRAAPELGLDADFIAAAVQRAGGNMQHAAMLRLHLDSVDPAQRRVEDIPRGLAALIASTWERIATDQVVVDGLGILCAAREALTLDEVGVVASWDAEPQRRTFLRRARELLVENRRGAVRQYRLHHESIRAHIAEAIGPTALRGHHRALASKLAVWPRPVNAMPSGYAMRHALLHRAEAGDWADAWRIAGDMTFLETKCRELGAHAAEVDVARVAELCRACGETTISQRFHDMARALARESHRLRLSPDTAGALMWNRLRQLGWSTDDLDEHLPIQASAAFLRVRHVAMHESSALIRDLVGHTDCVSSCAVTPDGGHVVSASYDGTLKIWELESGRALATLEGHTGWVMSCAVTPDGRRVVSASNHGTLKIWDVDSGLALATLAGHASGVNACAVTPDGRRVVSASLDGTLRVWDLESFRMLGNFEGHGDCVTACAVTRDGRRMVSASWDKTLKVWDIESRYSLATMEGHTGWVLACALTPDGRRAVSGSDDRTLRVWDLDNGRELATLEGHVSKVCACAALPDGRLVSASSDGTVKVWDLKSGHPLATLEGHTGPVLACSVTPNGRRVVSGSYDRTLKVWDLDTGYRPATQKGHTDWVTACAVSHDGRRVVSASRDCTLKVWDADSGRELANLRGHTDWVMACAVTVDGKRVVSASGDKTLKVWDVDSARELATLKGHTDKVTACLMTPDDRRVVSASWDGTLKAWDIKSAREIAIPKGHIGLRECTVTRDGRSAMSGSNFQTLEVWDIESCRAIAILQGRSGVIPYAINPENRRVIAVPNFRSVEVWDLESGRVLASLEGHTDQVEACAMTHDNRRVVSASDDRTLKIWDLETRACLLTHHGRTGFRCLAVTLTGVVAGDIAGTVWFLDWPALMGPRSVPAIRPVPVVQSQWSLARIRSWWRARTSERSRNRTRNGRR